MFEIINYERGNCLASVSWFLIVTMPSLLYACTGVPKNVLSLNNNNIVSTFFGTFSIFEVADCTACCVRLRISLSLSVVHLTILFLRLHSVES
jgi:hypothetical protein